jgi:hypothetical protein
MLEAVYYQERRERFDRILARISPEYAFDRIGPEHGEIWLRRQPETTVSSRSFLSACAYAGEDVMYCRDDAEMGYLMVLLMESDNHLLAFPPLGDYHPERFALAVGRLRHIFELAAEPFRLAYMSGREAEWVQALPGLQVWTDPAENDYICLLSELTRFTGRKNASRRQSRNQFLRQHQADIRRIVPGDPAHMKDCAMIMGDWCSRRGCASCGFRCPKDTAVRALRDLDRLHAEGVILYVDGAPEALMLFGDMGGGMADMLSLFVRHRYSGLFHYLIEQICRLYIPEMTYLNFEEDMGIPNLRRFKESLCPARLLLPKYRACL